MRLDGSALSVWTAIIHDSLVFVPVELENFTVRNESDKIILQWQTASELNNKGFEVERKFGNSDFASVGFVEGKGTTTEKQFYNFIDKPSENGLYSYRLKQIDFNGVNHFSDEVEIQFVSSIQVHLEQNYPNPTNARTVIQWSIPIDAHVKLKLYDVLGREVLTLVDGFREAGLYENQIDFNKTELPSGIYFYELRIGSVSALKKLILIK
ncbi:MAG: T9SS type A sorting domain-containing protein [Ignavibacterium sp.]|nr:T9SS type A sorting domain-containing protein [Ignavibacterium sp.]